ncbi:MAG: UDP-glucose 6-dehydrogenase [Planctomycetaceae bacterium]|nr:UDP-glucose 6-dehydrogenase [Planctomycetaceae bacterium]
MKLAIVGTGYVGLVTGTCLANTGNHVTCVDIDAGKIQTLREGGCPIYEPGLEELLRRNLDAGRLTFTTDMAGAYQAAEAIFICVGTPSDDQGHADLRAVLTVAEQIGDAMEAAPGDTGGAVEERRAKIIIVKSTVPVGTNAKVHDAIEARTFKRFAMASNPEFLKEGDALSDFNRPDRVVVGVADATVGERLRELYEPFVRQGNPIHIMDIASAEMVKYAANAMLATKISFINEIAQLCESHDADIDEVRRGMCADHRIGNQFLYPGLGYGGSCFPKDVLACVAMGEAAGTETALLRAVHEVNQAQRDHMLRKIVDHFGGDVSGKRLAVWGLAFKQGTDDVREAPSVTLIEELLRRGATVSAYDPAARETAREVLGDRITYAADDLSALDGADALLICTNWDQFMHPDLDDIRERMKGAVVFDGRNLFRPSVMADHGLVYYSVGRGVVG